MKFPMTQSFRLTQSFLDKYKKIKPNFGFNGLGEFVFMRTYSRITETGKNETWQQTVQRVVEGIYSIQRQHIEDYNLGWNQTKSQKSAQEMYDRIFNFKMLPSGRSLWAMGTNIIKERGLAEALYSCCFLTTENINENPSKPFANAMDFLMCGIGIGADLKGANKIVVKQPHEKTHEFIVPDSREGWVESIELLIDSFFVGKNYVFDYSLIRKAGEPIRTFGGISAGSKPLRELHKSISKFLTKNIGKPITSKIIADIFNVIGKAVVSGNIRRSAEILIGSYEDKEFMDLKNYKINPDRRSYGWSSNNSIYADIGMDYSDSSSRTIKTGEPGYIWIENARKYSRIRATEANYKDKRASGLNPCFAYSSRLLTSDGYKKIGDLEGKSIQIYDKNGEKVKAEIISSGNKEVIELKLSNRQTIQCTPNHMFMTLEGKKTMAKDLKNQKIMPYIRSKTLDDKFILLGFIQGDGNLTRLNSKTHKGLEINVGLKDKEIIFLADKLGLKYTRPQEGRTIYVQGWNTYLLSLDFDASTLPNREFPSSYNNFTKKEKASFLNGCFTANGCINNKGRITYKATSNIFISKLKETLKRDFGIDSYITTNKPKMTKFKNGTYLCKESYDLNIAKFEHKLQFFNEIGFYHKYKTNILKKHLLKKCPYVRSIRPIGVQPVYDFSMEKTHWGVVNGFIAHNCGEITLESGELCNLVETFPDHHESLDDYKITLKYAYLYAKSITLLNTHWSETNRVMLRNRRIGLSMSGIAQFVSSRGLNELKLWMKEGYDTAKYYDKIYSDWLAIPESIKITTIKPSGTISLLAGATPGIHFPESQYYIRRVRIANNSSFINVLKRAGHKIEKVIGQEDTTSVVEFPVFVGKNIRSINDVSMWEQLGLASFVQRNWSDNSVSVTITFGKKEEKDIANALNIYQFQLKAVSFLPKLNKNIYPQMPYEAITEEEYNTMAKKLKPLRFSKMESTRAIGEKYCTNDTCEL